MAVKCRHDCEYYSTYTETCDYTLLMFETRGCPTDACVRYTPRAAGRRPWNVFRGAVDDTGSCGEDVTMRIPEPPEGGMECERYIVASCGHEVYDGESYYEWEDGETLCPECVESKFGELGTSEKAALLGCDGVEVRFPKRLA